MFQSITQEYQFLKILTGRFKNLKKKKNCNFINLIIIGLPQRKKKIPPKFEIEDLQMQELILDQLKADKNVMMVSALWVTYVSDREVMSNNQSTTLEGSTNGRKLSKKPERENMGKKTCECTSLQCTDWTSVLGRYRCAGKHMMKYLCLQ